MVGGFNKTAGGLWRNRPPVTESPSGLGGDGWLLVILPGLGGWKCCPGGCGCLVMCLEVVGAFIVGCLSCLGWLGKSTPGTP